MQSRAVRLTLLSLVLLAGLGGAFFTWDIYRRASAALERGREVEARLDRLSQSAAALGTAQQAYVAPGQQRGEWLGRATASVQQLYDNAAALRVRVQAPESAAALRTFGETVDAAVKADDRARENLRIGQELMAADIVYTEARQSVNAMNAQLDSLRKDEGAVAVAEGKALVTRAALIAGGCALIWLVGLVALARIPVRQVRRDPVIAEATAMPVQVEAMDRPEKNPVDLAATADVCVELSRLGSASALPDVLGRVAQILDARGIVVWLGAGHELFVASAHGYQPDVLSRLSPISRSADNPTAEAWRKGKLRLVPSTPMSHGALVVPLFRPDGCFGVLAAEVRHQREREQAVQSVATMIAAQLSVILAAGPAPSAAGREGTPADHEPPIEGAEPHQTATA